MALRRKLSNALFVLLFFIKAVYSQQSADCDYKVEILLNDTSFTSEEFSFKMLASKVSGTSTRFSGVASIEDSDGDIIKGYKPWTNQSISIKSTSRTYTPNLKPGNYKIMAEIDVDCNDADSSNNIDEEDFEIIGEEEQQNSDSGGTQSDAGNDATTTTTSVTTVTSTTTTTLESTTTTTLLKNKLSRTTITATTTTSAATITGGAAKKSEMTDEIGNKKDMQENKKGIKKTSEADIATASVVNPIKDKQENKKEKIQENKQGSKQENKLSKPVSKVVYESSSETAKKAALLLLAIISVLLAVVLIWKR